MNTHTCTLVHMHHKMYILLTHVCTHTHKLTCHKQEVHMNIDHTPNTSTHHTPVCIMHAIYSHTHTVKPCTPSHIHAHAVIPFTFKHTCPYLHATHTCITIHTVHVHTLVHRLTHSCLSMHSPHTPVHSHARGYKNQIGQETKDLQPSREGREGPGGSRELGQAVEGSVEVTVSERGTTSPACIALSPEAALCRSACCLLSVFSSLHGHCYFHWCARATQLLWAVMATLVKLLLGEMILGQKAFPGCYSRENSWDMTLCPACGPSGPKEPRRAGEW